MRFGFCRTVLVLAFFLTAAGVAHGATVRALALPDGFTIKPEAERRLMTITRDGAVFAIVNAAGVGDGRIRALRWAVSDASVFKPLELLRRPRQGMPGPTIDAIAAADAKRALVTVGQVFDGAYLGFSFEAELWSAATASHWSVPENCNPGRYSNPHVFAMDDRGNIALTLDSSSSSPGVDSTAHSPEDLPTAALLGNDRCAVLGSGIATGVRGGNVVGYLGYLDGFPAPMYVNLMVQQMHAMRWHDGRVNELGPGVPYATTSSGFAAGATALPGHAGEFVYGNFFGPAGRYEFATPHAVAWEANGRRVALLQDDSRSIAWDVADDATVVGMLQEPDGKHYAFRWRSGRVQRLDDLPHPARWRFESAYAIGADGAIVGVGTHDGVAAAFVWHE